MAKGRKAPRRGASRAQSAPRRKGIPGWLWLVSGLVIGLFVAFLLQLEPGRDSVRRSPEPPKPATTPAQPPADPKPRYDFYTLLPESEVVVPQQPAPKAPTTAEPETKPATSVNYYLQAGSFRQRSDADAGFPVSITRVPRRIRRRRACLSCVTSLPVRATSRLRAAVA